MTAPTYAELAAELAEEMGARMVTHRLWQEQYNRAVDAEERLAAAEKAEVEIRLHLAKSAELMKIAHEQNTLFRAQRDADRERLARAEAALRRIAEHPHCSYERIDPDDRPYSTGAIDGHRCAALIARLALAPAPKEGA